MLRDRELRGKASPGERRGVSPPVLPPARLRCAARLGQDQPLQPFGRLVQAATPGQDLRQLSVEALRDLARQEGILVLRGFGPLGREALAEYASTWGKILTWNFGPVLDLIVHDEPRNYLFTNGSVPFHWDGAFAEAVPEFQIFQCLQAPQPGTGGETLFCATNKVWQEATPQQQARWQQLVLTYATDKVAHYGGRISAPLTTRHPRTGRTILRFAEPANETTSDLNAPLVGGVGLTDEEFARLLQELRSVLYHPRYCYAHAWEQGDFLVADNLALLHGRRAFLAHSPRHLQRVHVL
jgi:alpha-ketoglutarate-dependent taurine dioxygenase